MMWNPFQAPPQHIAYVLQESFKKELERLQNNK